MGSKLLRSRTSLPKISPSVTSRFLMTTTTTRIRPFLTIYISSKDKKKFKATRELSNVFIKKPAKRMIHIIVQLSSPRPSLESLDLKPHRNNRTASLLSKSVRRLRYLSNKVTYSQSAGGTCI